MIKTLIIQKTNNSSLQFFRYFFVGGAAAIGDTFFVVLFSTGFQFHYLIATVFGFCIGVTINYLLSNLWVFSREMKSISKVQHFRDISTFVFIGIVGLIMTMILMWLFHEHMGLSIIVAKLLSLVVVFWNFLARKYFVFR